MVEDETDLSEVSYRPNFRVLGPRFGKQMKEVGQRIGELTQQEIEILKAGDKIAVAGGEIGIEDVEVQRREKEGVVVAIDNNLGVGLDVQLDDELVAEGVAREIVNRVQNMRKDAGLEVSDRIRIGVQGEAGLLEAIGQHREYIAAETLALELSAGALPDSVVLQQELQVNDYACTIAIARA
ncbi:MAG: DUF5915 domain-containing protein, partial [Candidatus Latescibacteria bacterium]|nr:DUF5915 domain-containing protein [Candidatus Latescibacterota bacterium]